MEAHYRLRSARTIERVDPDGVTRRLEPLQGEGEPTWGYHGSGPILTATMLLRDATGAEPEHRVARAFVSDVIALFDERAPNVIAVREVRAWRDEREMEILAGAAEEFNTREERADRLWRHVEEAQRGGGRAFWLETFRSIAGSPDIRE